MMKRALERGLSIVIVVGLASGLCAAGLMTAPAGASGSVVQPIDAGNRHSCALTPGGGVQCWGYNFYGQLGDGTTTDSALPVDVAGLSSGVTAVAAGDYHTCALTSAGGVKCWGQNDGGQLGDGTQTTRPNPADVTGLTSGVIAISAGIYDTCAVMATGTAKCWGRNVDGEVGNGTTSPLVLAPTDVVGLSSLVAIAAGNGHACALASTGAVSCWGSNDYGQLGNGTFATAAPTPVAVTSLGSGVAAVSAGSYFSCAVTNGGAVKCWGINRDGELGTGTVIGPQTCTASAACSTTPVNVTGLSSGVTSVATADFHACGLTVGGGVKCWGNNDFGPLGNGTGTSSAVPVDVSGLSAGVTAIAAGGLHSCALTSAGEVQCWGQNGYGELGNGGTLNVALPVDVPTLAAGISAVSVSNQFSCARTVVGGAKCWGSNRYAQLGDTAQTSRWTPADVSGLASGITQVSAGGLHACALTVAGGVKCWGYNVDGELGNGTNSGPQSCFGAACNATPGAVSGLSSGVAAIAAGNTHTCALTVTGGVLCWGHNYAGQVGDGGTSDQWLPTPVPSLASGVTAVSTGGDHTCALTTAGGVKCWGNNDEGELGDGTQTQRLTPVDVAGLTSGVTAIAAAFNHTCALTTAGAVKCWGTNEHGELGQGTLAGPQNCPVACAKTPVDVSGLTSGVTGLSSRYYHSCVLTTSGGAKCWGLNNGGELGDGTTNNNAAPVDVSGLPSGVASISVGNQHTCAVTTAGNVKCWGYNGFGQVGINPGWRPVQTSGSFFVVAAPTAPNAPTIGTSTAGNSFASVAFAPGSNGGSGVLHFDAVCTSSNGGATGSATGSGSPIVVSGLSNGYAYSCRVTATNAVGASVASAASNVVVPTAPPGGGGGFTCVGVSLPSAPGVGSVVAGDGLATVRWKPPSQPNGGLGVIGYVVTPYIGLASQSSIVFGSAGTTATVTGLKNGSTYVFKVAARNPCGTGAQSKGSAAVRVGAPGQPTKPIVTKVKSGSLKVAFIAPTTNGAAIKSYTATCVSSNRGVTKTKTGKKSSITVGALSKGKTYTCTITATNSRGAGPPSTKSPPVKA